MGFDLDCQPDARAIQQALDNTRRIFFLGNSIMRELMFDTEARLTNATDPGSRSQHQALCGKYDVSKFPSCTRVVRRGGRGGSNGSNGATTLLVHQWVQLFNRDANLTAAKVLDNCTPRGWTACLDALFQDQDTAEDVLFLFIGQDDAIRGALPLLSDRAAMVDAVLARFQGVAVFVLPCALLVKAEAAATDAREGNAAISHRLHVINTDSALMIAPRIRTVAWEKTCMARAYQYKDHIHPNNALLRLLADRAFAVVAQALTELG